MFYTIRGSELLVQRVCWRKRENRRFLSHVRRVSENMLARDEGFHA
jgi:hypothetical protein